MGWWQYSLLLSTKDNMNVREEENILLPVDLFARVTGKEVQLKHDSNDVTLSVYICRNISGDEAALHKLCMIRPVKDHRILT